MTGPRLRSTKVAETEFYSPDSYDLRQSLGFLLRENSRMAVQLAESSFAAGSLGFSQWLTLFLLSKGLVSSVGDLARALRMNTGGVTRLVDQLERRGLVERQRSLQDRRSVLLMLTCAGGQAAQQSLPRLLSMWNDVLDEFGHDDARQLIKLLSRLSSTLHKRLGPGQTQSFDD